MGKITPIIGKLARKMANQKIEVGMKIKAGVDGLSEVVKLSDEIEALGGDTAVLSGHCRTLTHAARQSAQSLAHGADAVAKSAETAQASGKAVGFTIEMQRDAYDQMARALNHWKNGAPVDVAGYISQWSRHIRTYKEDLARATAATADLTAKTQEGTVSMQDIAAAAATANYRFGQIDKTTLGALNAAIDAARAKIRALADEAAQTRANLEADLAALNGDNRKAAQLEQERKLRELNLKLAEAEKAHNGQAIAEYRQAIELQEQIFRVKQRQEAQRAQEEEARKRSEAAQKAEAERARQAAAAQAERPPTVIQIGNAAVPAAVTADTAAQIADTLEQALGGRDQALVQQVVRQMMQQIQDELKRRGL